MDPRAVKAVLVDLPAAILKGVNAVRDSKYAREHLKYELAEVEKLAQLLDSTLEPGLPTTQAGEKARQQLESALLQVQQDLKQLKKELPQEVAEADGEPAVAGATCWLHRCWHMVGTCFKAGAGWGRAAYDAAFPPNHQKALTDMHSNMEAAYQTAKEHRAFTCAKQMSMGLPDLYIRHEELFNDAVTKLLGSAADTTKQQRGLLITGSWGMGKTTLARDVAKALSPKSPEMSVFNLSTSPFPDGVYDVYFGPVTEASSLPMGTSTVPAMVVQRQHQLLRRLQGLSVEAASSVQSADTCQVTAADVHSELATRLKGKRCLLVLDDVRSDVVPYFKFDGFKGALLVTGLSADAWRGARVDCTVAITPEKVQAAKAAGLPAAAPSMPALEMRLLASRALNDKAAVVVPEGCEVSAQKILDSCHGSVLALVVIGSYLWCRTKPDTSQQPVQHDKQVDIPKIWRKTAGALPGILSRTPGPDTYTKTVFGAIQLCLEGAGEARKNTFLALELFRPGVPLPLSLLQLAVQQYTGVLCSSFDVWSLLDEIKDMGLLESFKQSLPDSGNNSKFKLDGTSTYQLPPILQMYLDKFCTCIGGGSCTSTGCSKEDLLEAARTAPASSCRRPRSSSRRRGAAKAAAGSSQQPRQPASLQLFSLGTGRLSASDSASRVLALFLIHFGKEAVAQAARSLLERDHIVTGGPPSVWGGCSLIYCEPGELCEWVQEAEKDWDDKDPSDVTGILNKVLDRTQTDLPRDILEEVLNNPTDPSHHTNASSDADVLPGECDELEWDSDTAVRRAGGSNSSTLRSKRSRR